MTLAQAKKQARTRARLTHITQYVLGPCSIDGYWICGAHMRAELWPDRAPVWVETSERGYYPKVFV
jgi:hypothetical protein